MLLQYCFTVFYLLSIILGWLLHVDGGPELRGRGTGWGRSADDGRTQDSDNHEPESLLRHEFRSDVQLRNTGVS